MKETPFKKWKRLHPERFKESKDKYLKSTKGKKARKVQNKRYWNKNKDWINKKRSPSFSERNK